MSRLRIALHGHARVGKDEFGKVLGDCLGLKRVAIGDIIKSQLDPLIRQYLGHSAFTEDDQEKSNIRNTLVWWGYANYSAILSEFMTALPERAINTRIFRYLECKEWVQAGGVIYELRRPGHEAVEPQEKLELEMAREAGLISKVIDNDGSLEEWRSKARRLAHSLSMQEREYANR